MLTLEYGTKKPIKWELYIIPIILPGLRLPGLICSIELGCPYAELEKDGFFLPVLSCDATFHQPAFFDDRLTVDVRIEKVPTVRIEALYEIRNKGELITSGSTQHAFVSQKGGVVRPPERFAEVARSFFNN